jgi:hypothetical protein
MLSPLFNWIPPMTKHTQSIYERLYFLPTMPIKDRDDEYKSYEQFKAKLCIQSLAFFGAGKFEPLCRGSVLKSRYEPARSQTEAAQLKLSTSFNELLAVRYSNVMRKGDASKRSEGICALRNYLRKNYAYWLTKGFSLEVTGSAPVSTPAAPATMAP